jgi:hypothetical protein
MDRFAAASLTLIDGDLSIPIRPPIATAGDPIACRSWDLGAPDVRITSNPRPGADGTTEGGGYFGSRTVTMELLIRGDGAAVAGGHSPYWYVQQLAGMCHPQRSPQLRITRAAESSDGTAWYLRLRGNPWSLQYQRTSVAMLDMTLTFTAPSGYLESEEHTVVSGGTGINATDWHFPSGFPHSFGNATNNPFLTANVAGSAPVNPVLFITGPVVNPKVRDDAGRYFIFNGLTLAAGETVRIDMGDGSVLKADPGTSPTSPAADVFGAVDFTLSTFWQWQPGLHKVALLSSTGTFALQWRDRHLMI